MTDIEFTSLCQSMMMELQRTVDNEKAPPSQSILGIMKNFIDSVNEMDETVLIPSRLMDINMDNCHSMLMDNDDSSTMSVISTSTSASSPQVPSDQVSLHTYYSMLKAVKRELARGPVEESELSELEDETVDEESARLQAQTARAFREHLRGLFSILSHLTNVSKNLMTIYQQETGDQQSCLKPKSFHV
ncbi:mid1-interacting protein 1A-like [Lytechinus variegatus]|uniref:mid1-interacting protein 1A-like n=1 Tax=Lytechinus variegatus TaxID=7654 RepID=UPI001BB2604B|nr:mid1-interacting protein 1A-like [Lytechinus variegatus]XP_041482652.1 mid1-interacting protein 1A-like [Lytechinus variegatus]